MKGAQRLLEIYWEERHERDALVVILDQLSDPQFVATMTPEQLAAWVRNRRSES